MTANRNAELVGKDLEKWDLFLGKTSVQWNSFSQNGFGNIRRKLV